MGIRMSPKVNAGEYYRSKAVPDFIVHVLSYDASTDTVTFYTVKPSSLPHFPYKYLAKELFLRQYELISYVESTPTNVNAGLEAIRKHNKESLGVKEKVNHPAHYGGDTTYEAIKVIEAWGLNFNTGNSVKYICRAGHKEDSDRLIDLRKALWYLQREIDNLEKEYAPSTESIGPDTPIDPTTRSFQ